jgi:hypothetical protein
MMFQPYLSLQEGMKKNLRWWQEIGWLPSGPKFPPGMVNPFEAVAEGIKRQNSGLEKNGESEVASTSIDMELLMEKIKELEEKIKSMDKSEKSKEREKEKDTE